MRMSNHVCARSATMSEQYMFHMSELIEVIATMVILIVTLVVMIIKKNGNKTVTIRCYMLTIF